MKTEEIKEIEGRDLRKTADTLRMALRTCELRGRRLNATFTVADLNRLGIELLYAAEVEMLKAAQQKAVYDIVEIPS